MNRREFIKSTGMVLGAAYVGKLPISVSPAVVKAPDDIVRYWGQPGLTMTSWSTSSFPPKFKIHKTKYMGLPPKRQ